MFLYSIVILSQYNATPCINLSDYWTTLEEAGSAGRETFQVVRPPRSSPAYPLPTTPSACRPATETPAPQGTTHFGKEMRSQSREEGWGCVGGGGEASILK